MISGREALAQLEGAISTTRADENRLDAALASAAEEAERLRAEEAAAFRRLASVRLDTLASGAVSDRLDRTEREAIALLAERRKSLADLAERRGAAAKRLDEGQGRRHETAGRLEEIAGRMSALEAKTKARLAGDEGWRTADARVADAEATARKAEAKARQAEADRIEKGKPYEDDRLFVYLWEAGWGTGRYAAMPFVRFFDAKVARLSGFDAARPNYAMLTEIPVRLAAHAERLRAGVGEVAAARTAIERAALEADGIEALEREFAAAKAEIDAGNAGIASTQNELATLDASRDALVGGEDPALARALDGVAQSLAARDLKSLYADAYSTPTPDDEAIVRQIEEIGRRLAAIDADVAATRARIRDVAQRRGGLEDTRDRFRRSGYDRPGVSFGNENLLGQVIGGIIGGVVASPELWRVILGGYRAPAQRDDGWIGGGPRVPGGGDWFGGGSSQGGSGGSSGGFGGDGGFSTGGGFGGDDSSTGGGF